nr:MAG TPA: hypothetical protein [Caudoviricetes sp.]
MASDLQWLARGLRAGEVPTVGFIGDSYSGGSADVPPASTIDRVASRRLGVRSVSSAQGGTGYITDGKANIASNTVFGSAERVGRIVQAAPDAVAVVGGLNDEGKDLAQFAAAVKKCLADLRAGLPDAPIVVVGPQPSGGARTVGGTFADLVKATADAVASCGVDGVAFVDWAGLAGGRAQDFHAGQTYWRGDTVAYAGAIYRVEAGFWAGDSPAGAFPAVRQVSAVFTGTGKAGAPAGDGNRDLYISADGVHPTNQGSEALGDALAACLRDGFERLRGWVVSAQLREQRRLLAAAAKAEAAFKAGLPSGQGGGTTPTPSGPQVLAWNGYGYKDGSYGGVTQPRIGDIKKDGLAGAHLDCWACGSGEYVLSSQWCINPADQNGTSIYNRSLADLRKLPPMPAGGVCTFDEALQLLSAGATIVGEYGPCSTQAAPSPDNVKDTAKWLAHCAGLVGASRFVQLTWQDAASTRAAGKASTPGIRQLVCVPKTALDSVDVSKADIVAGDAQTYEQADWAKLAGKGRTVWVYNARSRGDVEKAARGLKAAGVAAEAALVYTREAAEAVKAFSAV